MSKEKMKKGKGCLNRTSAILGIVAAIVAILGFCGIPTVWDMLPAGCKLVDHDQTDDIVINGKSYSVPTDNDERCLGGDKASRQTGDGVSMTYNLTVPEGWYIVWDSHKAYWSPPGQGEYENDGLLAIYGPWKGTVHVVTGEYCAVPVEWYKFAWDDRKGAVEPQHSRVECIVQNGVATCQ